MPIPPLLDKWLPVQNDLSIKSILFSSISALFAIGLVSIVSQYTLTGYNAPFLAASMGASAVLLFVVPTSPLAQPWAFIGGHLVSAFVGVCCAKWIPNISMAAAIAVGISIFAMYYLRCMHPPGGAAALLAVLGGDSVHALGFYFVVSPILLNVSIMLICAFIYWRLTGVHQHKAAPGITKLDQNWIRTEEDWLVTHAPFSDQDLNQAINSMGTFIDINRQDLKDIYIHALQKAHTHNLSDTLCKEIMSQPVISVVYGAELDEVWRLFEQHNIRGVPVVDNFKRVIGIVTVSNFVHSANQIYTNEEQAEDKEITTERLALLRQRTSGFESDKPEVAGQIMTTPVITASEDDHIIKLVTVFTEHGIHHIPVVNAKRKLVGIITREDIMTAHASS